MTIDITLPIKTVSEANKAEHWSMRWRRRKAQRRNTHWALKQFTRPEPPLTIKLVRISPRMLDSHDNLAMSMKAIVDGICDWLGIDDGDDRLAFKYDQARGKVREQAVRVTIEVKR